MRPTGTPFDWARAEVATPRRSARLPGVSMAGFRARTSIPFDLAVVAHPSVTLLVDLSDGDGITCSAGGRKRRGSVVIGLLPGDLRVTGRAGACLQIRLEPAVAAQMLGISTELNGAVAALTEVWGRDAERVEQRLRHADSWDERFAIAAELLGRRRGARRPADREIAYAWRRTLTSRGRMRVDSLADEIGWSRKRLWARFGSQLGITPKCAARLVRFDHAAHLLAAGQPAAEVAARCGYVDQSHLHRDAKAFTGLTPAGVAAAPWLAIDDVAWPAARPRHARPELGRP